MRLWRNVDKIFLCVDAYFSEFGHLLLKKRYHNRHIWSPNHKMEKVIIKAISGFDQNEGINNGV